MGQTVPIDVTNGFYQSDSLPFSNQRCVNLFPQMTEVPALTKGMLLNVQGLNQVASVSILARDSNRGGHVFNGIPYVVNGGKLYRIERRVELNGDAVYDAIAIEDVDGMGFCSFADNGRQMIIITQEGTGYIFEPTSSPQFQVISDAGFTANGKPQQVVFVDGYFVVTTDAKKAIVSAINDGLNWNALDFISAESDPDEVVAPFVYKNQLYLLGTQTTEAYNNIGGAGVPFRRSGFFLSQGCSAPFSVCLLSNVVMWLGRGDNEKPSVYLFAGGEPEQISTTAIDNILHEQSEQDIKDAFCWAYSLRGSQFLGITVAEFTFVYDLKSGRWHERQSVIRDTRGVRQTKRCRINCVLNAYNELIVGDSEDGRIGVIDENVYMEYDDPLISFFTTAPLYLNSRPYSLPQVELLCEAGVGNSEVTDPKVRMEISRDGAVWENPRTRSLGATGNRRIRQLWNKNGMIRQYSIFRFTISDAVKRRIYGIEANIRQSFRG